MADIYWYISRYKILRTGHERSASRKALLSEAVDITGQSTFQNKIRLWAWKRFVPAEPWKSAEKRTTGDFIIDPYDDYIRDNFVLSPETGLAKHYKWLLNERSSGGDSKYKYEADAIVDGIKKVWKNPWNTCRTTLGRFAQAGHPPDWLRI